MIKRSLLSKSPSMMFIYLSFGLMLFLYRFVVLIICLQYLTKITTLGDSFRYMDSNFQENLKLLSWLRLRESTYLLDMLGSFVFHVTGKDYVLSNMIFSSAVYLALIRLSYVCTKYCNRYSIALTMACLLMPSFTVWSVLVSKEAFGVIGSALLVSEFLVWENKGLRSVNYFCVILGLMCIFIFKKYYLPGIAVVTVLRLFRANSSRKGLWLSLGAVAAIVLAIVMSYDQIDALARQMIVHFKPTARSTRSSEIFSQPLGFYSNMAWGVFMSLWGPSLDEVQVSIAHCFSWLESLVVSLVTVLFVVSSWFSNPHMFKRRLAFISAPLACFLVVHYPFGVLNPGSAIRYRTNITLFILLLLLLLRESSTEDRIELSSTQ